MAHFMLSYVSVILFPPFFFQSTEKEESCHPPESTQSMMIINLDAFSPPFVSLVPIFLGDK